SESVSTISARRNALSGSSSTTAIMQPALFSTLASRRIRGQASLEDVVLACGRNIDRRVVCRDHREIEAGELPFGTDVGDLLSGRQRHREGDEPRAGVGRGLVGGL